MNNIVENSLLKEAQHTTLYLEKDEKITDLSDMQKSIQTDNDNLKQRLETQQGLHKNLTIDKENENDIQRQQISDLTKMNDKLEKQLQSKSEEFQSLESKRKEEQQDHHKMRHNMSSLLSILENTKNTISRKRLVS